MLEDNGVHSSVPAEAVTTAIINCASFHSLCCVMNRKVNAVFLCKQCVVSGTGESVISNVIYDSH